MLMLRLLVSSIASPEWVQKPDADSQLEEGHAGYLHCYTRATPDPEVTWYRSMQPVASEVSRKMRSRCLHMVEDALCPKMLKSIPITRKQTNLATRLTLPCLNSSVVLIQTLWTVAPVVYMLLKRGVIIFVICMWKPAPSRIWEFMRTSFFFQSSASCPLFHS